MLTRFASELRSPSVGSPGTLVRVDSVMAEGITIWRPIGDVTGQGARARCYSSACLIAQPLGGPEQDQLVDTRRESVEEITHLVCG